MKSPTTEAREYIQEILTAEFKAERITVRSGFTDNSLAQNGVTAGVFPISEMPNYDDRLELHTSIGVDLLAVWDADPDVERIVDPSVIESYANRFRVALAAYEQTGTDSIWWFELNELNYDTDPTANITRFSATVVAHGTNPAP